MSIYSCRVKKVKVLSPSKQLRPVLTVMDDLFFLKILFTYFFLFHISFFNIYYWLCYYSCPIFSPRYSPLPCIPLPPSFPHFSSCPWFVHTRSLASPFPIIFLPSLCLFCTYHLCFLFPVPFSPFFPLPLLLPTDNPPCDLHFCDFVPVLVVCFCFSFRFSCW